MFGGQDAPNPVGEGHGMAKLTEGDVIAIRASYRRGITTLKEVAKRFGTSASNVCSIVNRKLWRHI